MSISWRIERSFLVIVALVCAVHLVLIAYMGLQPHVTKARTPRKPVHVQSIQLQPVKAKAPAAQQAAAAAPIVKPVEPKAKKEKKAEPKPVEKKAKAEPAAKKSEPTKAPEVVKKPKIAADKIAQVKADLMKIQRTESAIAPLPKFDQLEDLPISSSAPTYEEILADRLRMLLTLPDYGDVKISLTLDRRGKVVSVKILKSASDENRQYVELSVPKLSLPPFGASFGSSETHTFQLVLSN